MANRIQLRRDTAANWTRVNPILEDGEPGLDITVNKVKYGDGSTHWRNLPFAGAFSTEPSRITDGTNSWRVGIDGKLTSDLGGTITKDMTLTYPDGVTLSNAADNFLQVTTGTHGVKIGTAAGTIRLGSGPASTDFYITKEIESTNLYFGDPFNHVKLPTGGNVEINSTVYSGSTWKFADNNSDTQQGTLYMPYGGNIKGADGFESTTATITNITNSTTAIISVTDRLEAVLQSQDGSIKVIIDGMTGLIGPTLNDNVFYLQPISTSTNYRMYYDKDLQVPVDTSAMPVYNSFTNRDVVSTSVSYVELDPFSPGSLKFTGGAVGSSPSITFKDAGLIQSGDFTMEFWFRRESGEYYDGMVAFGDDYIIGFGNANQLWGKFGGGVTQDLSVTPQVNVWHHFAITHQLDGMVWYTNIYLNGDLIASNNLETDPTWDEVRIGEGILGSAHNFKGEITSVRYSSVARYDHNTNNFSRPTSMFTPDSDTVLLLQAADSANPFADTSPTPKTFFPYFIATGTNTTTPYNSAGISSPETKLDIANAAYIPKLGRITSGDTAFSYTESAGYAISAVEAPTSGDTRFDLFFTLNGVSSFTDGQQWLFLHSSVGQPTWSTYTPFDTPVRSMSFNGTPLHVANDDGAFAVGLGDFTIEFWMYQLDYIDYPRVFDLGNYNSISEYLGLSSEDSYAIFWCNDSGTRNTIAMPPFSLNTWHHVAITREAGVTNVWNNGLLAVTNSVISYNVTSTNALYVGSMNDGAGGAPFNGYIRDFRFTKGSAVYTTTFTPPTAPLAATTGTVLMLNLNSDTTSTAYVDTSNSFALPGGGVARRLIPSADIVIESGDSDGNSDTGSVRLRTGGPDSQELVVGGDGVLTLPNTSVIKGGNGDDLTIKVPVAELPFTYWAATLGDLAYDTASEYGAGSIYDTKGNLYVLGNIAAPWNDSIYSKMILVKYDPNGNLLWIKTFDSDTDLLSPMHYGESLTGESLAYSPDGYLHILANRDTWAVLIKLDHNGNIIKQTEGDVAVEFNAWDFDFDADGNVYMLGDRSLGVTSVGGSPAYPITVVKWDKNFEFVWSTEYSLTADGEIREFNLGYGFGAIEVRGNYVYATSGFNEGNIDDYENWMWVVKLDFEGNEQWIRDSRLVVGMSLTTDPDNNVYVLTNSNSSDGTSRVIKYSANGDFQWITAYNPGAGGGDFDINYDDGILYTSGILNASSPFPARQGGFGALHWGQLDAVTGAVTGNIMLNLTTGTTQQDAFLFKGHDLGAVKNGRLSISAFTYNSTSTGATVSANMFTLQVPTAPVFNGSPGYINVGPYTVIDLNFSSPWDPAVTTNTNYLTTGSAIAGSFNSYEGNQIATITTASFIGSFYPPIDNWKFTFPNLLMSGANTRLHQDWKFDSEGVITFPDNTKQDTAWTGVVPLPTVRNIDFNDDGTSVVLTPTDRYVFADPNGNIGCTVYLPWPATPGTVVTVKNIGGGTSLIISATTSSAVVIDGTASSGPVDAAQTITLVMDNQQIYRIVDFVTL